MGILTLSATRAQQLQRFRRNTWLAIALCLGLRMADATLGLNLIEHTEPLAAQETPACLFNKEALPC